MNAKEHIIQLIQLTTGAQFRMPGKRKVYRFRNNTAMIFLQNDGKIEHVPGCYYWDSSGRVHSAPNDTVVEAVL